MKRNQFLAMFCAIILILMSFATPLAAFAEGEEGGEPAPAPAPEPVVVAEPVPAPPEPAKVEEAPVEQSPVQPETKVEEISLAPAPEQAEAKTEEKADEEKKPETKEEEKPTAEPTVEPTAKPTVEPTAKPTVEPTAEPTGEPTVKPTEKPTPEPTAEPTIEATAKPTTEPTAEPTNEPTVAPTLEPTEEPTLEPTVEPTAIPPVSLKGLAADRLEAAPDDVIHFSYASENAVSLNWKAVRSDGLDGGKGEAGADGFDWKPGLSGVYTVSVAATGADMSIAEQEMEMVVRAGRLTATAMAPTGYAKVGERDAVYEVAVSGGVEPWDISITVEYKGKKLFTTKELPLQVKVGAAGYGEHLLKLRVVDATGAHAEAEAIVLASDNAMDPAPALPRLTRSMTFADKLVAVANSQLGYRESETNFIFQEKKKPQGWTVYGAWAGLPYEEWCAMFVSWCLEAAGIPEWMMPRSANCNRWRNYLGFRYIDNEDEYVPAAGDLIFFHHERGNKDPNFPNHIGIVVDYDPQKELIYTVEGNTAAAVSSRIYGRSDYTIVGYASMRYCMRRWDKVYRQRLREQAMEVRAREKLENRLDARQKINAELLQDR